MIIVEGPDGSGKTTLVEKLLSNPDLKLVKGERGCTSDNGALPELAKWVEKNLQMPNQRRILYDRHPLVSDIVYGPLIRGYTSYGFGDFPWMHRMLNQLHGHNPLFIYCLPRKFAVMHNVTQSHEGKTEHLRGVLRTSEAIYDLYVHHAAMSPFFAPTWVWDYESGDYSSLCQNIRSHLGH